MRDMRRGPGHIVLVQSDRNASGSTESFESRRRAKTLIENHSVERNASFAPDLEGGLKREDDDCGDDARMTASRKPHCSIGWYDEDPERAESDVLHSVERWISNCANLWLSLRIHRHL